MESQIRLEYELKKAIEEEDYEKSAELRDKLNRLTNK
jgi:protein-arginine kinase activator protein McsA